MITLSWWTVTVAKLGWPATLLILTYLGLAVWLLIDVGVEIGRHVRARVMERRRLRQRPTVAPWPPPRRQKGSDDVA